jgi:hypothetical protein
MRMTFGFRSASASEAAVFGSNTRYIVVAASGSEPQRGAERGHGARDPDARG